MVRFNALTVSVLLLSMLAGCNDVAEDDDTSEPAASDPCPTVDASSVVSGWTSHGARWGHVDGMEGRTDVVCGEATGAVQSLVQDGTSFTDFQAWVSFNMLAGDSGAGLVVHYKDDSDFNIVRYSPREQGWHLFTMIDGNRQKQDAASVTPPTTNPEPHEWVRLRVVSEGGHVEAWDGETKVISYDLPTEASHEGGIGYFLRDDGMAALFDDFSAEAV